MQFPRSNHPHAPVKILAQPLTPGGKRQHGGQENAGGNRRAFEILNLVTSCGETLRGNVESRQSAYSATDKVNQGYPVPAAAQSSGKAESGGGDTKRKYIGQRVEFPSQRGMLVPPARYAPI